MDVAGAVLFLSGALLAGFAVDGLARRLRAPSALALMLTGFAVSELVVGLGHDSGLRWYHFHGLVSHVLVPVLLFETASRLEPDVLARAWRPVALLAGPGLLAGAALTAAALTAGIGHASGFPLATAAVAAVLLAAIEPAEVLRFAPGRPRVSVVVEGEAVFSDVAAVALFAVLLSIALGEGVFGWARVLRGVGGSVVAGAAAGLLAGLAFRLLARVVRRAALRAALLSILAAGVFVAGRAVLPGAGALALLVCVFAATRSERTTGATVRSLAAGLGRVARVVLFVLAGATVTTFMFRDQWLAMLIAIAAVTLARFAVVEALLRVAGYGARERLHVAAGGSRGAIVLALALSLPLELPGWYTAQSMAYGVVLFTLACHPALARLAAARAG